MLQEKERKLLLIFSYISIGLSLVVCIPFGTVTLFEILLKYLVIAVIIGAFTGIALSKKYKSYHPAIKYNTVVTYAPLASYAIAVIFNTLMLLVRSKLYATNKAILLVIGLSVILLVFAFLAHLLFKAVVSLNKNEAMLVDGIICVLTIVYVITAISIAADYKGIALGGNYILFLLVVILLGGAAAALHVFSIMFLYDSDDEYKVVSRKELIDSWKAILEENQDIYDEAYEEILESMYNFSKEKLGYEGESDPELAKENERLNKRLNDALAALAAAKGLVVETLQKCADNDADLILSSLQDSLNVIETERENVKNDREQENSDYEAAVKELQDKIDAHEAALKAAEEEEARKAAAEEERRKAREEALANEPEKEPIQPAFEEFVEFAKQYVNDDVVVKENEEKTQVRLSYKKTQFIGLVATANDYRISFLATDDQMRSLLFEHNGIVTREKGVGFDQSGYELQQLKISYKGDGSIEADVVKELMSKALENLNEALDKEAAAKEEAAAINKFRKQYQKEKAAEAEAEEENAEEASVEEAPAEEAPVEEAPVEEVPAEETPAEEAPAEEAPAEEEPKEE